MKEIIEKFITDFNEQFRSYLEAEMVLKNREKQINENKKLSDWDMYCKTNDNKITKEILKSMEGYVNNYPHFQNVGILLTKREDSIYMGWHHISKKPCLHMMAFIPNQSFAPFIDIQIDVPNELLESTYSEISGQDFDDWIVLTNWRKQLNNSLFKFGNNDDVELMLPVFKPNDREEIKRLSLEKNINKLEPFFEEYFKNNNGYSDVITFFKENHQ